MDTILFNKFNFKTELVDEKDCHFHIVRYRKMDGKPDSPAWFVYDSQDNCIMHVSRNFHLPDDQIAVKDYSENKGVLDELHRLTVIDDQPLYLIESGWVQIPVFKLTELGKNLVEIETKNNANISAN